MALEDGRPPKDMGKKAEMIIPREWSGIVIHHTAGTDYPGFDIDEIKKDHQAKNFLDVGYHFLIEKIDGGYWTVLGRPLYMDGAHTLGYNKIWLGFSFVGDFTLKPPDPGMLSHAAKDIRGICASFGILRENILPHSKLNATDCPGKLFPWDKFIDLI